MRKIFDDLLETSANIADQVVKTAGEYIDKGKDKIDEISLKNDLAKAQKQLGILVYTMHKTGEQNEELFNQYIDDIDKIELEIREYAEKAKGNNQAYVQKDEPKTDVVKFCHNCGAEMSIEDSFCKNCGAANK